MSDLDEAIEFVMEFYDVTYDDCVAFYWDEIEAYMRIVEWKNERTNKSAGH